MTALFQGNSLNLLVLAGLALSALVQSQAKEQNQQPNFLLILADDLGWTDLGCYGSTFYETPSIDAIAASGMKFVNGYAACPVCSPTRASIVTGKYPARIDLTNWLHGRIKKKLIGAPYIPYLPLEEITLAEAMKDAGYQTFFAGKWHLGSEQYWPEHQGFNFNKGGCEKGGPYGGGKYFSPYGNPRLEDGPPGEHLPDRLAQEAIGFMRAHRDRPFFAYLSFYSVHTPLMAREDLRKKYLKKKQQKAPDTTWGKEGDYKVRLTQNHAVYAGMIEAMDQAVGKVLAALDRLGLTENTVIIFTSDNGGMNTAAGHPTSNHPLRAGKGWLYEGGIREPFIIQWPGVTPAGSTCEVPVISTDIFPTILAIAGIDARPDQHRDGTNLTPLLRGGSKLARKANYWHYPHYSPQGGTPSAAVRSGDYKLLEFFEDNRIELYHLRQDIGETRDLSADDPVKVGELKQQLHAWQREVNAEFPSSNPEYRKIR